MNDSNDRIEDLLVILSEEIRETRKLTIEVREENKLTKQIADAASKKSGRGLGASGYDPKPMEQAVLETVVGVLNTKGFSTFAIPNR